MNILPLVIGCIVIFSYLGFLFLKEGQVVSIIQRSVSASFEIEKGLQNKMVSRQFSQHSTKKKSSTKGGKRKYDSIRSILPPIEESKLDIGVLLDGTLPDVQSHCIYAIALNLLCDLYGGEKALRKRILDEMIRKGKLLGKERELFDLFPEDRSLKEVYYKMLKGTNQYEVEEKKQGLPPLSDFFKIGAGSQSSPIHFCFASKPLLRAAVGKDLAEKIIEQEKKRSAEEERRYFFSKEDLQAMLMQDPQHAKLCSELEPHCSFSSKIPRKEKIAGKEKQTGLVITRPLA
ncbi:MAG: hypothetical protein HYZ48_03265 [Chlamydiales bacterium]|nr:hypothetical protein [Chlamydiales bacterium]